MSSRPALSADRRRQICEVAVEVIAARGLADTRLADVAAQAGVSAALVLYYFGSKEKLLAEALTFAEDRFQLLGFHEMLRLESARDQLVRVIELAGFPDDEPSSAHWTLWMELWVRALRDPDAARQREALDRRWRSMLADVVRLGQRRGEFAADADVDEVVATLAALIDGLALQVVLGDPSTDPAAMRRRCLAFAARELGFDLPAEETSPAGAHAS